MLGMTQQSVSFISESRELFSFRNLKGIVDHLEGQFHLRQS